MLLNPDQKPFWAGTYLPKPQLLHLLHEAARLWREDRTGVLAAGEALTAHRRQEEQTRPGAPSRELIREAVNQFAGLFGGAVVNGRAGGNGSEAAGGIADFLQGDTYLGLTVLVKTPENADALAVLAQFTKDYPIPAQGARYYLCRDGACARPVDSIAMINADAAEGHRWTGCQ